MNLAHTRKNSYKKTQSLAAIEIKPGDLALGVAQVGLIIPARCVLTSLYAVTEAAHNGGVVTIASTGLDDVDDNKVDETVTQASVGVSAELLTASVYTDTGMKLTVSTAALMTSGCVQIVAEYDEPTLSTGKLTNVA